MDVISLADNAVKEALRRGCDAAEVFIKTKSIISAEAKDGEVEALEAATDIGAAVRVIKNKRLGFSYTTNCDELWQTVERAAQSVSWADADEYNGIPEPSLYPQHEGRTAELLILDREIEDISKDEAIKKALLLEEGALKYDKRVKKVRKAMAFFSTSATTIHNSNGVSISYNGTSVSAQVGALAQDGNDTQMGWDYSASRKLNNIDFTEVGHNAAEMAVALLGARRISPVKVPVVLNQSASCSFLGILSSSLSADAVQKKKSMLSDKTGKEIISPLISVIDDGLMPWGLGTKPVDDEGIASYRKGLISRGVLTGFIHNTYTAKRAGCAPTGNAVRGSFKGLPGVDVTNLYIEAKRSQESGVRSQNNIELIKSISKGILVLETMGMHTANPISGDFSIGISGLWIENGEPAYSVKEAIISGNILELFKKVEAVGDDLKFYGNIGSPSLLIGEMDVSA
ncbi:MAG: TldD/PmbA family protein [Nitrospirae bacterium]|nr:TldD/PmbA family protein [Nitrospirota bacterium]